MLIVPSIRENSFNRFIEEWSIIDADIFNRGMILMEDNPSKTFSPNGNLSFASKNIRCSHYSWEDINDELGEDAWIIPRRSDTVRSFAYFKAWQELSKNGAVLLTLDDDCYPDSHDSALLFKQHIDNMSSRSKWFNTLNNVKPRGIPFYNLGKRNVYLNHGLWTNVLDYDAPTQLVNPIQEQFSNDNKTVPRGTYFPMCGMNVAWRNEITVLMYHLLMGCIDIRGGIPLKYEQKLVKHCPEIEPGLYKLPFDRFGDIWCGIIMKKICDHLDYVVTTGTPYIKHDRASNPFTNLRKEANGIEVNEIFWQKIDTIDLSDCSTPSECYREIGIALTKNLFDGEFAWYFEMLGGAMCTWSHYFSK